VLAVSARASHGLQKSLERLRAHRSAPPVPSGSKARAVHTERVNGGSATSMYRARERNVLLLVKGDGSVELGDPHHVSAASSPKTSWVRPHFGAGGLRGGSSGGRHLGSGKRTPFTRPPRNRSWRPPSHGVGLAKSGPTPTSEEEATGVSETIATVAHEGRKRPRVTLVRSSKWGSRCEPRFSPASFASGGPSCPVPAPQVSGRAKREREKWTFRVNEHEPQGSERVRLPRKVAERHLAGIKGRSAGKRRSSGCSSWIVSECRSRSDAPWSATPVGATQRTRTRAA